MLRPWSRGMIQMQRPWGRGMFSSVLRNSRGSEKVWARGRWSLRRLGNPGDLALVSCGENWPFIEWDSKSLKGWIWLFFFKDHPGYSLENRQGWTQGAQWGAIVIFQEKSHGGLVAKVVTVGRWEVVFWPLKEHSCPWLGGRRGVDVVGRDFLKVFWRCSWPSSLPLVRIL